MLFPDNFQGRSNSPCRIYAKARESGMLGGIGWESVMLGLQNPELNDFSISHKNLSLK
jgi:hypothetical protein